MFLTEGCLNLYDMQLYAFLSLLWIHGMLLPKYFKTTKGRS